MNDQDRLQQMEDNFNAGDSVYQALGLQLQTQRSLARFIEQKHRQDEWDLAVDYFTGEGYSNSYAQELAEQQLGYGNPEDDEVL